jgi:TIR domain
VNGLAFPGRHPRADVLEIFISFASVRADEAMLERLEAHLSAFRPTIAVRHRGHVAAGAERVRETSAQLARARVALLLISADYLASETCRAEAAQALVQHTAGETRVIPIIVRACHWHGAPWARLKVLPAGERRDGLGTVCGGHGAV